VNTIPSNSFNHLLKDSGFSDSKSKVFWGSIFNATSNKGETSPEIAPSLRFQISTKEKSAGTISKASFFQGLIL
jgi:hypothetical protein